MMPTLRFDDGDLLIMLGPSEEDWLLLHRNIVAAGMPLFATMLRWDTSRWDNWAKPRTITHPITGLPTQLFTLSTKCADETVVLGQGADLDAFNDTDEDQVHDYFHKSQLSLGWPNPYPISQRLGYDDVEHTVLALKALFALIYGYPISLKALQGRSPHEIRYNLHDLDRNYIGSGMSMISLIGAYAEYYGGLPRVAPGLVNMLLAHPYMWRAVERYPHEFAVLAGKLRHKDLYFDAGRQPNCKVYHRRLRCCLRILWDKRARGFGVGV